MATAKQLDLIQHMYDVLDTEFNFGTIGQKRFYSVPDASELIQLNSENFYNIIDAGQCTIKQYNELTKIAGRKPKFERWQIGFAQAVEWINKYKNTRKVG